MFNRHPGVSRMAFKAFLAFLLIGAGAQAQTAPFTSSLFASGFDRPLLITAPPGDGNRVFIVEQTGKIRIVKSGTVLGQPFLDLSAQVSLGGERGLLGLAFHPSYASNGFFFISYTDLGGTSVIERYQVSTNPDRADASSATGVLRVAQPQANHNGGMLAFGPRDGFLYIGMGDGGGGNDPGNNAQTTSSLLGKILRIDVDQGVPYGIPPTNPFVGRPGYRAEIWALGLRNPWRFSFDRQTGDLYIADVGQNAREEVNFQAQGSGGGQNYGWRCMEGTLCTGLTGCTCNSSALTLPIHEYSHALGCSVTGGYVYRGSAIPGLQGTYFFADFCRATIWSFRYAGNSLTDFSDRSAQLESGSGHCIRSIASFGEDALGELYIASLSEGKIFKIVPGVGGVAADLLSPAKIGTRSEIRLASPLDAGMTFVSPFSLGNSPGILLPDSRRFRLEPDFLFTLSLHGGAVFSNTIGVLDAAGLAKVGLVLPNDTNLLGLSMYTAFLVLDPAAPLGIGRMCCPLLVRVQ